MEVSTSYELDKFLALRRMWESVEGDPTGEETTSVSRETPNFNYPCCIFMLKKKTRIL